MKKLIACLSLLLILCTAPAWAQVRLKADFGAVGDGIADDTAAVHAFLAACAQQRCYAERGRYRVCSAPARIEQPIALMGEGIDVTEFIRDYNENPGRGFLHFENWQSGKGPFLSSFSIKSAPGRRGGSALAAISQPGRVFGNLHAQHLKFSTDGKDSWDATIYLDGTANHSGSKGLRGVHFQNCQVFGAKGYSLDLRGVVGFQFMGGGVYAAGGTTPFSGGVRITGSRAVPSSTILLIGDAFGYLNLSHVSALKIIASGGIAGGMFNGAQRAMDNDSSVDHVQIMAEMYGVWTSHWTNSSIIRPDGSITR